VRFLSRDEIFDRLILNACQFPIAQFAITMAGVSVFKCLGAKQAPDLIDAGVFRNGRSCFLVHRSALLQRFIMSCKGTQLK